MFLVSLDRYYRLSGAASRRRPVGAPLFREFTSVSAAAEFAVCAVKRGGDDGSVFAAEIWRDEAPEWIIGWVRRDPIDPGKVWIDLSVRGSRLL